MKFPTDNFDLDMASKWQNFLNQNSADKKPAVNIDPDKNGMLIDSFVGKNIWDTKKSSGYQSKWESQLDDTMKKILDREFSYNMEEDPVYHQYKDQYIRGGKMAMEDAIGQASSMTGGYANSFAQSVGQQQYQQSLDNLGDIVPELYQMALDRYTMEGQDLLNQYSMIAGRESLDYSRYRDTVADERWKQQQDTENTESGNTGSGFDLSDIPGIHTDDASWFDENGNFKTATFLGTSGDKASFRIDGKTVQYDIGVNPYTQTVNPDTKKGTFSNGYQPDNIGGKKLKKSDIQDYINGVWQNVWKTPDGTLWIWDETQNKYLKYEE